MRTTAGALNFCFFVACGQPAIDEHMPSDFDAGDLGPSADASDLPDHEMSVARPPTKPCSEVDPRSTEVLIAVLPEEGEAPYATLLRSATKSIRVFGYQMGFGAVLDTLKEKAAAGLDVRVILDGETQRDVNTKYRTALEASGAQVKWGDSKFSYMHAKSIVVDDREASVSTGNYSRSYILKERNFVARLVDPYDVRDLAELFDADWKGSTPTLTCTRLLVSPINARSRTQALIESATTSLDIESMQLSDTDTMAAVLKRKEAGVNVRVILADPSWIEANAEVTTTLRKANVATKWQKSPGVHVKWVDADRTRAYVGSANFSRTSLDKNREIGIVVTEPAALEKMEKSFEADWARAQRVD